jgi:hypothetical protein
MNSRNIQISIIALVLAMSGCGGTKVLKEPQPLQLTQALATASDEYLVTSLDWVIFRDGPGTWAKNVDWDEYMLRVQNLGAGSIQITGISVVDSLGNQIEPQQSRKQLVKGTKATKRRYKGEGLKVKAGLSGTVLVGAGAVAVAGSGGLGAAAMAGGGAAAGAAAVVVLIPVLAVGGLVRGVNNSRVDSEIQSRQMLLPVDLQEGQESSFHIFFPLAPSPQQIEITYVDSRGDHKILIDTQVALDGLHLASPEEIPQETKNR